MDTIAPLLQLDQQCSTWASHHAHSCNLIASLLNITRQREQTLQQLEQQTTTSSISASTTTIFGGSSKAPLLASRSLQLLIHKQTLEIESVLKQLYDTLDTFKKTVQAMVVLERQVESAIQRIDTSKLLETIRLPPSSVASLSSQPSQQQPLSPSTVRAGEARTTTKFSHGPSLLETAEISPLDVLDWVSRIRSMYGQELSLKETQIHPGMIALERFESLQELQRSWGLQRRIDFGLEQEILERIKAYKRVREFSSRS
ncbi:hypothetical protein BGZ95_001530 [Linnemannia exigua]|uniref:Uncharacterized protein n=1 Tax=Linnemannia exigua TaxID=604196 RepID=A0AAD4DJ57_9FUNG|nr:hypothetical protein BGZ95_001530 [Linnemannia exigua]